MLSGDQNIVDVQFSVPTRSAIPRPICSTSPTPRTWCGRSAKAPCAKWSAAVRRRTFSATTAQGIADSVRSIIQASLDSYNRLSVNADLDRGRRAAARSGRRVRRSAARRAGRRPLRRRGQPYANKLLGDARGQAAQIREDAAAYKNRVVQEAEGEAQRFISVYDEYAKAPEVTRKRLFLETMEQVLRGSNKVIIERGNGQGVVPYLPLPELEKRKPATTEGATDANRLPIIGVVVAVIAVPALFVDLRRQRARAGDRAALRRDRDVKPQPGIYFKIPISFFDATPCRSSKTGCCASTSTISACRSPAASSTWSTPSSPSGSPIRGVPRGGVGQLSLAEHVLRTRLDAALRQVYGLRGFEAALSEQRADMMREVRDQLRPDASSLGIEIVDVRIRRTDLTAEVSQQTFERMKAERLAEAARLRARGREAAQGIRAKADREAVETVAEAQREAEILRGEGEAERSATFAAAFQQDPEFFEFYRSMHAYDGARRAGHDDGAVAGFGVLPLLPQCRRRDAAAGSAGSSAGAAPAAAAPCGRCGAIAAVSDFIAAIGPRAGDRRPRLWRLSDCHEARRGGADGRRTCCGSRAGGDRGSASASSGWCGGNASFIVEPLGKAANAPYFLPTPGQSPRDSPLDGLRFFQTRREALT